MTALAARTPHAFIFAVHIPFHVTFQIADNIQTA
jgi:hypothetical protein